MIISITLFMMDDVLQILSLIKERGNYLFFRFIKQQEEVGNSNESYRNPVSFIEYINMWAINEIVSYIYKYLNGLAIINLAYPMHIPFWT